MRHATPAAKTSVSAPQLRFRIRVTRGSDVAIGPGKIALLESIREHGSITVAAKHIGMSYRRAWLLLDEVNRSLRKPATTSAQGGAHGGGSLLTPEGETLIRLYREIERQAEQSSQAQVAALLKMVVKP